MPRFKFTILAVFGVVLGMGWATHPSLAQAPKPKPAEAAWEANIEAALEKSVTLEFVETPLKDVLAFLSQLAGQQITLDAKSLDNVGVGADAPVTLKLKDLPLRSALRVLLRQLGLSAVPRDGALIITSQEEAETDQRTDVLDVVDLIRPTEAAAPEDYDYDSLIDTLTTTVAPTSWSAVGGPGSIERFCGRLVIRQSAAVQSQIRQLLVAYRQAKKVAEEFVDRAPPQASISLRHGDPLVAKIQQTLDQSVAIKHVETPLEDVISHLRDSTKLNIILDRRALDELGVGGDTPVTFQAESLALRHCLSQILRPLGLRWLIHDQVLLITSPEEAEKELTLRVYPVADLLGRREGVDLFGEPRRPHSHDDLVDLFEQTIAPTSWDTVGGPGSIASVPHIDVLVIAQTDEVHEQIVGLLTRLRKDLAEHPLPKAGERQRPQDTATRVVIYRVTTTPNASPATPADKPAGSPAAATAFPADAAAESLSRTVLGMAGRRGGTVYGSNGPPVPEDKLAALITDLIEPQSWKARPDVFIKVVPGRLVIRQTVAAHRQINALLNRLGVVPSAGSMSLGHLGPGMF